MFKEFEGKTEEEAINKAIEELDLQDGEFDVEVLESAKKSLFKKSFIKIRVHYGDDLGSEEISEEEDENKESTITEVENDLEKEIVRFLSELIFKMGYDGEVKINYRKDNKIGVDIVSPDSYILIGRKGKNLDAIQLLVNVVAGNIDPDVKVVVDSENYRLRHEEAIVRNAYRIGAKVRRTGKSELLEPMNPFERRLVHTAINGMEGLETISEGEGLYKQVRILPSNKNSK